MDKKINILGTEYSFSETTEKQDTQLYQRAGYADLYEKKIGIETDFNENGYDSIGDFNAFMKKVKRHELIHAFFFESGLTEWADNECLVNWVAVQFPKMLAAFREVDAM